MKRSKLFKVAYPNSGGQKPALIDGQLKFSLGLAVRCWFGLSKFFLPMPSNIDIAKVKEFTILPKNGAFYLELSYEVKPQIKKLDINQALSIDLGTADNLAACVDSLDNSLLIDARTLKAMNQSWNKKVSTRKEDKLEAYWDDWLNGATRKRNHQIPLSWEMLVMTSLCKGGCRRQGGSASVATINQVGIKPTSQTTDPQT